jgi:hypothetical protein
MPTEIYFDSGSAPLIVTAEQAQVEDTLLQARSSRQLAHFEEYALGRAVGVNPEQVAYIAASDT